MKKHYLPWRHMNTVCGANRKWLTAGKVMAIGGFILSAVGYALTADTICKFDNSQSDSCETAHEFVDAVLA